MKCKIKLREILMFTTVFCFSAIGVYPSQINDNLSLDSSIRSGELSNGISYYIKQVPDTSAKIDMRLVVKVGHNHQEPGESEFAHIVEHLGFSAGKNVSVEKSSNLFDEVGIKLVGLNGQTFDDYTTFMMIASGNNKKSVDVGLLWFQDIIWNLELTERNIDRERTAVINEINQGAAFNPNISSRYKERKMIGYEEVLPKDLTSHIRSFKPEALVRFYKKWYRPDSMALVIVGDVKNIEDFEINIRKRFSKTVPVVDFPIRKNRQQKYLSQKPQFLKGRIPQLIEGAESMAILNLYMRDETIEKKNSIDDLKRDLIKQMFIRIVNKRHKENQEFYGVNYDVRTGLAELPFSMKSVVSINGKFDVEILKNIVKSFVQIEQYGFSNREFIESKHNFLQALKKQDTSRISYWRNGIISHYVRGEVFPANKKNLKYNMIKNLSLDEFNLKIKGYLKNHPDDIIFQGSPEHPLFSYSEKGIHKWFAELNNIAIKPYTSPQVPKTLIDSLSLSRLNKSSYKERQTKVPLGKEFELENGLKLILRAGPKSPQAIGGKNQIYFQGFVNRGMSHFSEEDFFSALNSPSIVMNSGVGGLDKFELQRYLTTSEYNGRVRPYIEYEEAGVKGVASIEDLETALQLANLYLTDPNFSDLAFVDWKSQEKTSFVYQDINRADFLDVIRDSLMYQGISPKGTKALEGIDQTNLKTAMTIYRELFSHSQNLTFLFSGVFEESEVLDLCRKYLGNLPSSKGNIYNSNQKSLAKKSVSPYSSIMRSTKPTELAMVRLVYIPKEDTSDFNWQEEIKIEILRRSMTELLMRRLRFESATGGTYQVTAGRYNSKSYNHHEVFINFQCEPSETERLIAESKGVVNNLRENVLETKLFAKIRKGIMPKKNESESPQVILRKMYDFERHCQKWVDKSEKRNFIKSLTAGDILLTAQKYLSDDPFEYIMLPK